MSSRRKTIKENKEIEELEEQKSKRSRQYKDEFKSAKSKTMKKSIFEEKPNKLMNESIKKSSRKRSDTLSEYRMDDMLKNEISNTLLHTYRNILKNLKYDVIPKELIVPKPSPSLLFEVPEKELESVIEPSLEPEPEPEPAVEPEPEPEPALKTPPLELNLVKSSIQTKNIDNFKDFINLISDELNLKMSNEFDDRCDIYITMIDELSNDDCLINYNKAEIFNIFNCRKFISNFPINNPDIEYKKNIHIPKISYVCYNNLFEKINEDTTQSELKSKYDGNLKYLYLKYKLYLDGCDIMHDVLYKSKYLDELKNMELMMSSNELDVEFPSDKVTYNNNKIKNFRNNKVIDLKEKINVQFPLTQIVDGKVGKRITREEGFIYFFKEIAKVYVKNDKNKDIPAFTYRESGRELSLKNLVEYYNSLNDNSKQQFQTDCKTNDQDGSAEHFLEHFKTIATLSKSQYPDLEIKKNSISSFDACKQTMCSEPNLKNNSTVFLNIYSKYDYFLYSDTSRTKPRHVVMVRNNKYKNYLVAIFLIEGDTSINFLLDKNNEIFPENRIAYTRKRSKTPSASFIYDDRIINIFKNILNTLLEEKWCNIGNSHTETYENLEKLKDDVLIELTTNTGYYFSKLNSNEKQLVLLGNKTIGDLIFTSIKYKKCIEIHCKETIYSISTTDSFIWASVLYNYLCGNSDIIQSVWQKDSGGGWIYAEGIFSQSKESKIRYLLLQSVSILAFIRYYVEYETSIMNSNVTKDNIVRAIKIKYLKNVCKIILKYIFKIDDITNDIMLNIVLNQLPFNRIRNSLHYIMNFNIPSIINITNISNPYEYLSYEMIKYEFNYKNTLIKKYVNNIIEIQQNISENFDYDELFKILNSLYKLSNMFYINTISVYKNNLSNIKNFIDSHYPVTDLPTTDLPLSTINIFKINPNLEKVIIKEQHIIHGNNKSINKINLEIVGNVDNPDVSSIKLILNLEDQYNINNILLTKKGEFPYPLSGSKQPDIIGYEEIGRENGIPNYLYNYWKSDTKLSNTDMYERLKEYINTNYVQEISTTEQVYYTLVNNTLNYSSLEIIIFSKNNLNDTYTGSEDKNIHKLGTFNLSTDTRWLSVNKKEIHIYLWNVDNTTDNLFNLLRLQSIQNDTLSTTLIITKILKNFKTIMIDYKIKDDSESEINNILAHCVYNINKSSERINQIFYQIVIKNIELYVKTNETKEDTTNENNIIRNIIELYLESNDVNSSLFSIESNENEDDDENKDDDGDTTKKGRSRKKGGNKITKKKKYIKKRKQTKKK